MARLVIIDGPDRGKEIQLDALGEGSHLAGRDPRHPISIADSTVSRDHFRLERQKRAFRLIDLGSRNRTFLNGEPVREGVLRNGDVIAAGDSEMRFEDDAQEVEVAEMASTILKEFSAREGSSIGRIIDSLKHDPSLREERIRGAVDRLRQLYTLSREILRTASIDDLYRRLLEILVPALEADRGVVMQPARKGWAPRAVYPDPGAGEGAGEVDGGGPAASAILVSDTIVRRVAEEDKAILSANAPADSRFRGGESIIEAEINTVIAAPISIPGTGGKKRVVGVLYADRRGSRRPAFTEDELHLLTAAAEQAGEIAAHLESEAELRNDNRNLIRFIADSKRIVGGSRAIAEVLSFIRKAAPAPMTVLIHGETGTGKELVAAAIHYQSARQGKPFVAINCAALPENLLESELFGYEKGAFTGATTRKKGRFELAHTGTLFLDEIGELSPGCQAKLLRLIEDRRIERVGGTQPVDVDVRLIAATNKDLPAAIEKGEFREDLYYRINVLSITLPPLRERPEDIPLLARHFLSEMGFGDDKKVLSPAAEKKLLGYSWPGNIRQLRNVMESAVVLGEGPEIRPEDLVLPEGPAGAAGAAAPWQPSSLEEVEKNHILRVLDHTEGNKKRAAEILGIERCTLYARLRTYGLMSSRD